MKPKMPLLHPKMNLFQIEKCKTILREITEHPLSKIFCSPVDPIEEGIPNYFNVIKTPMDLSTISKNIDDNKYQTIEDWKSDISLVWNNAIKFFTKQSFVGIAAVELERQFNKMCEKHLVFSNQQWMDLIANRYKKINQRINKSCGVYKTAFTKIKHKANADNDANPQKGFELPSSLTDRGDVLQILQILNLSGMKTDLSSEEISIPASKLHYDARKNICNFVKNKNKIKNTK